jgi:transcription elongation factor Elf1
MRRELYVPFFPSGKAQSILILDITDLSAAVDVYADWVDACDAVAKEGGGEAADDYAPTGSPVAAGRPAARNRSEDDEDIGGAEDDDGMDGYGGEGIVADDEEY